MPAGAGARRRRPYARLAPETAGHRLPAPEPSARWLRAGARVQPPEPSACAMRTMMLRTAVTRTSALFRAHERARSFSRRMVYQNCRPKSAPLPRPCRHDDPPCQMRRTGDHRRPCATRRPVRANACRTGRSQSAAFDKTRSHDPDARRREAAHASSTRRRTPARTCRSSSRARRTASRGCRRRRSRPRTPSSPTRVTSSSFQDIRGRFGSEGQFVMLRPPRDKRDAKAIDEGTRHVRHDRVDAQERPAQQRPRRHARRVVPGMAHRDGDARPASGAQGRVAAGVAGVDVHRRRLPPQRRVPAELRLRVRRDDGRRQGVHAVRASTSTTRTAGISSLGSLANINRSSWQGKFPTWNNFVAHPNYDDVLAARGGRCSTSTASTFRR